MTDIQQRTRNYQELIDLVVEGYHVVDHGVRGWEAPLTEDFSLAMGDNTVDAAFFRNFLANRADASYQTRHVATNFRLAELDGDAVRVEYYATVHRLDEGADAPRVTVVDMTDEWLRTDAGWLLRHRRIAPALMGGS